MSARSGIVFLLVFLVVALVSWFYALLFRGNLWTLAFFLVKDHAKQDGMGAGTQLRALEDATTAIEDNEDKEEDERDVQDRDVGEQVRKQRRGFRRSVLTKLKIIIAAWQIASSTGTALLQVRFPPVFQKVTHIFGILGIFFLDVGSFKCLFGWSYFEKMLFVTLAPAGVAAGGVGAYWLVQRGRGKLETDADRRRVWTNIKYATLLFLYVILPSISTYVITYFSCARFDRGNKKDLKVIAAELSIKCTSKRYRRWAVYAAVMIAIWPVGATLATAVLLWSNRAKLNPTVLAPVDNDMARNDDDDVDGFQRERRRHANAMGELAKLKVRANDASIAGLEFLFEDFEPRCYMFPIFEVVRRLFLSSVLAVFYPGSLQQVVVGLLGAMLSYVVYVYYEAYIEDDDDVVAIVASGQLVLIYFAALAVYASDISDKKRGVFRGTPFGIVRLLADWSFTRVLRCSS